MKILFVLLMINLSLGMTNAQDIRLPEPTKTGGMPLMEALSSRQSVREMSGKEIPLNILSDLLWAAQGVNREDGKRTAPSAMNMQEIDVYVYTPGAVYLYIPGEHMLQHIVNGDFREETVRQPYAQKAPLILVYVANYEKMQRLDQDQKIFYGATDAAFISQNVYLFCAQEKLNTVVLGMIDREAVKERIGFNGKAQLGQVIGYPIPR
ncbi:MAG: SagB/ThcOx family dehydrogenase [Bacteroidales bacterium]|jgi:SagB-type dehydrogenase family enzyme